ncbi:hypothetical protein FACS1894161_1080 [Spirochaetia bacterium]|nr:hypothetical protein FACS1894161_1080 [Spirochaetia bacterium]
MKFYEVDNALQEAIIAAEKPVRVKIQIELPWGVETVFERDIVEADFYGLKEAAGGTSARGEILLENTQGIYSYASANSGTKVKVSFSLGEGLAWFERFVFYLDDKGIQDIKGPGRKRFVRLGLRDLSTRLRKTDEKRDWTSPAVFTYSVVCDKTQPGKSLVHGIAQRAGLSVTDIDCSTIPVTLPFVRLTKNIWAELSGLATAYRCHLECAPEKPLVFAHSPYQSEPLADEEYSYTFSGENIFYLRKTDKAELYRNTVRLKINLPIALEKCEIWRYGEAPVLYDEFLQPHYPFKYPLVREIEGGSYEARYSIIDVGGKERAVVFADLIDTKEEAENRLDFDSGPFSYSGYDITTHYDRAILQLHKEADGDLYKASIYGRPIVLDLNRSCFVRDSESIAQYGTAALNVTGSYFSEYEIDGKPQYEDWVARELAERIQNRREFTVKTHRGLFNARVGAKVKVSVKGGGRREELEGRINAMVLRYRRDEAFVSSFRIREEISN